MTRNGWSQPATARALIAAALEAGATSLKPAAKSLWGFGGVVQALRSQSKIPWTSNELPAGVGYGLVAAEIRLQPR